MTDTEITAFCKQEKDMKEISSLEEEIHTYAKMCSFTEEDYTAIRKAVEFGISLSKQEKDEEVVSLWSRLTDNEKHEMQCRYHTNECVLRDHKKRTGDKAQSKAVTRMRLLENLFGKENLKVEKK